MKSFESRQGGAAFVRVGRGEDLLRTLNDAAKELGIRAGTVQVIGAVSRLVVGYFDQEAKEYVTHEFEGGHELAAGLGNVSIKDGEPFVHLHVVAADPEGRTVAGHLMEGTVAFLGEAYYRAFEGEPPVRTHDDDLNLAVWQ